METIFAISALFFVSATIVAWHFLRAAQRITYVTLADGRRQERSLPLFIRMMLPFASSMPKLITENRMFEEERARIERQLIAGGYEGMIHASEVLGLRMLMPVGLGGLFCVTLALSIPYMPASAGELLGTRQYAIDFLMLVMLAFYPDLWLRYAVKMRHRSIERALPFVLDLLTLSVESGLDFMSGIQRIINFREIDPLGEELIRVFREIQVGRSRKVALQGFADRVGHTDIRTVTNALIQADELGTGIGSALRIQSDQIRVKRFQRAEKLGNEAPVKMLFPLVAFIFPSVFLVLLGPIILQMVARGGF